MSTPGLDYSRYESEVNPSQAYAAGCRFILHKVTDGTSYAYAALGVQRLTNMRGTGLVYGGYHFLQAGNGAAQADYFYSKVSQFLNDPLFTAQLDWESTSTSPTIQDARNFVARWHALTNNRPIFIYLPQWYANQRGFTGNLSDLGPLWASHYYTSLSGGLMSNYVNVPSGAWTGYLGWAKPTIVQYTDSASVANGSGMDGNAFDGTFTDLKTLVAGGSTGSLPPPSGGTADVINRDVPIAQGDALVLALPQDAGGKVFSRTLAIASDFNPVTVRVALYYSTGWSVAAESVTINPQDSIYYLALASNVYKASIQRLDAGGNSGATVSVLYA